MAIQKKRMEITEVLASANEFERSVLQFIQDQLNPMGRPWYLFKLDVKRDYTDNRDLIDVDIDISIRISRDPYGADDDATVMERWEINEGWEKVVCEAVIRSQMAPREAKRFLDYAMELMAQPGGSPDRIIKAMGLAVDMEKFSEVFD